MAIAYGVRVGTAVSTGSPTSLAVPVTTTPALTDTIVVWIAWRTTTTTVTGVTDSQGNTYTLLKQGAGGTNVRTAIYACVAQRSVLSSADQITVAFSTGAGHCAIAVDSFSGLTSIGVPDKSASATGSSLSPSSGTTATTAFNNELYLGLVGAAAGNDTFTPGTGYTALTKVQSNTGTLDVTAYPEYQIVSATGTATADGGLNNSRTWEALVVTLQDPQTPINRSASFVGAEVAFTGAGHAASFVGVEVAFTGPGHAASFVGVEVAYTPLSSLVTARRPSITVTG